MNRDEREQAQDELLEYLEGTLDARVAERVRARLETDADYRREFEATQTLYADLEAIGAGLDAATPEIDLVTSVMAEMERLETDRLVSFASRKAARSGRSWPRWAAAAAAAIIFILWIAAGMPGLTNRDGFQRNMARAPHALQSDGENASESSAEFAPARARAAQAIQALPAPDGARHVAHEKFAKTTPPDLKAITLEALLQLRRDAVANPKAREQLQRLAALAETPDDSVEALLRAIEQSPQDSGLRVKLIEALYSSGASPEAIQEQIAALQALDPHNALPYYQDALVLLKAGDVNAALGAMNQAGELKTASAYAQGNAQRLQESLIAGGVEPQTAQMLSALTAGTSEYETLYNIGQNLLEFGKYYAEQGDSEIAQQLLEAVYELGAQTNEGATFTQERLAGLDIERSSIDELQSLFTSLESTEGMQWLLAQTQTLSDQLTGVTQTLTALDSLFFGDQSLQFWGDFVATVLREGDLQAVRDLVLEGIAAQSAGTSS